MKYTASKKLMISDNFRYHRDQIVVTVKTFDVQNVSHYENLFETSYNLIYKQLFWSDAFSVGDEY